MVRARVKDGKIRPAFVDPTSERLLERADGLVTIFRDSIGKTRATIDEDVDLLIGDGTDKKLSDGLVKVLLDRSEFSTEAPIAPVELRRRIFALATARGPLAAIAVEGGPPTPDQLWQELAVELGHPADVLQTALYADHPDAQVLTSCKADTARWLLDRYNVALVQALLIHTTKVEITLSAPETARMRQLLRAVKFHQLLFSAARLGDTWSLTIDGPASLFSQTSRYGMNLAKFFPALLLMPTAWTLRAEVKWSRFKPTLELSNGDLLRSHYADRGVWRVKEIDWLMERFTALESGWTMEPETAPILQGHDGVVVPDLSFRKDGRVAHLEVLGFWRKGTIPKRLQALRKHGPPNLILAVSKRMCGEEAEELPDVVIPFAEVIPAREVLKRVEAVAR